MKFISLAIFTALASFTAAAPAPTGGQCVPGQGNTYEANYDMVGWYAFDSCTWKSLQFVSGVLKTKSSYNFVPEGNSVYHYCSKSHVNMAGAKAVDDEGNRYNVMEISGGKYDSTDDYTTYSYDTVQRYHYKYKLVGQGKLSNSVYEYSYNCHYSYDPFNGYKADCKKDEWSFKCSA
jgi:hypothetical protein